MGDRRKRRTTKRKGGVLVGLRGGFRAAVGAGEGNDGAKTGKSSLASNVITGLLVLLAAAMLLRRCGVLHF